MQYFLMKVFLIELKWDFLYNLTLLTLNYCKKADFASFPEQLSNLFHFLASDLLVHPRLYAEKIRKTSLKRNGYSNEKEWLII